MELEFCHWEKMCKLTCQISVLEIITFTLECLAPYVTCHVKLAGGGGNPPPSISDICDRSMKCLLLMLQNFDFHDRHMFCFSSYLAPLSFLHNPPSHEKTPRGGIVASTFTKFDDKERVFDVEALVINAKADVEAVEAFAKMSGSKKLHLVTAATKVISSLRNVPLDESEKVAVHQNIKNAQLGRETMRLCSDVLELVVDLYARAFT